MEEGDGAKMKKKKIREKGHSVGRRDSSRSVGQEVFLKVTSEQRPK